MPRKQVFPVGFLLVALLAALAAYAQDGDETRERDSIEPSVDTSADIEAIDPAINTSAEAIEDIDPALPSAVLAADVTRTESGGQVMDRMELGRTEITGNQELPKVLYIVPWQKADPGDLMGKPVNTLLDEVLAPIDRSEFIRQVEYYGDLYGKDEE